MHQNYQRDTYEGIRTQDVTYNNIYKYYLQQRKGSKDTSAFGMMIF